MSKIIKYFDAEGKEIEKTFYQWVQELNDAEALSHHDSQDDEKFSALLSKFVTAVGAKTYKELDDSGNVVSSGETA